MKRLPDLLGYKIYLIESQADCACIIKNAPDNIGVLGFDTETDTVIDMTNRSSDNINIKHDMPFLIQFGWDDMVFLADLRDIGFKDDVLSVIDHLTSHSKLAVAQNIKFDINMLMNIGYEWKTSNCCDLMSISRLALEAKTEREGGMPLALKPLAKRLLGTAYAEAGKEVDMALRAVWQKHLSRLMRLLKPYKISRAKIAAVLKDVTGTLDEFSEDVQIIWNNWLLTSRVSYKDIPKELLHKYAAIDVILVLELVKKLLPIVSEKNQIPVLKREMQLIMPLVRMERTGYTVDKPYLIHAKQALIFEINAIKAMNKSILGVDIGPNQNAMIKKLILDKYGYELQSTDKNAMSLSIKMDKTMPDDVKEYLSNVMYLRTLEKYISTYINSMLYKLNSSGDDKVYTQYNPNGAVSGRFTSNFQQFPKNPIMSRLGNFELFSPRKMFVVAKGFPELAYIDYSQVELRLQAEYTYYATKGFGDVNMIRAYRPFKCHQAEDGTWLKDEDNEPWVGVDLHTQSTQMAFPDMDPHSAEFKKMRNVGKRVNFAIVYGGSLKRIQSILADTEPETVEKLYRGFQTRFECVKSYGAYVATKWVQNGGYVTNLLGRRYYMTNQDDVYKLNNYLIQGSAADIIKAVIIKTDRYLQAHNYKTRLQGCIHDELCICVAEGEHDVIYKIKKIMESTAKTFVPLVAEISVSSTNWAEKKGE